MQLPYSFRCVFTCVGLIFHPSTGFNVEDQLHLPTALAQSQHKVVLYGLLFIDTTFRIAFGTPLLCVSLQISSGILLRDNDQEFCLGHEVSCVCHVLTRPSSLHVLKYFCLLCHDKHANDGGRDIFDCQL